MWVKNILGTILLIREHFDHNDHLDSLYKLLESWYTMPEFLGITKIDNLEQYEAKLGKFEENVKKLYDAGSKTVLTKIL